MNISCARVTRRCSRTLFQVVVETQPSSIWCHGDTVRQEGPREEPARSIVFAFPFPAFRMTFTQTLHRHGQDVHLLLESADLALSTFLVLACLLALRVMRAPGKIVRRLRPSFSLAFYIATSDPMKHECDVVALHHCVNEIVKWKLSCGAMATKSFLCGLPKQAPHEFIGASYLLSRRRARVVIRWLERRRGGSPHVFRTSLFQQYLLQYSFSPKPSQCRRGLKRPPLEPPCKFARQQHLFF